MSKTLAKMKADEREDRKRILLSATANLLESKDPGQIRIKDITGSLKISTATMYRYFNSKDAIFLEFLRRKADIFTKVQNDTPSELINYFNENKDVQDLLIYFSGNQRSLTPEQKNAFNAIRNIFFGVTDGPAEINMVLIKSVVTETHEHHL